MKKVLVTGGGGFVGSVIVRQLLENGCKVFVAARNRYPGLEKLGAISRIGDIGDSSFVNDICRDIDTVFHTAAKAGIWGKWEEYERTNVDGTRNILDELQKARCPASYLYLDPLSRFCRQGYQER